MHRFGFPLLGLVSLAFAASAACGACSGARGDDALGSAAPAGSAPELTSGSPPRSPSAGPAAIGAPVTQNPGLGFGAPDEHGMDARPLIELAHWMRDANPPVFSLLISRDGVLVYELYTSSLTRDYAHYLMSVTKSFTSALMGAAMSQGLVGPPETTVADALPASVFASDADRARFRAVTLHDVLGMSALDAQVPPHRNLPQDVQREAQFQASANRAKFALSQSLLPQPGTSFQYTDITPFLATGVLEYGAGITELELAEKTLFKPMGFQNYEWMHEDPSGIDNGAYGLRLRPVDMQKFGNLYLHGGAWNGQQLLPKAWVDLSFTPWIKSTSTQSAPNYGWYWWTFDYAPHWRARVADGWKGQRISVIPEKNMVVTMTGIVEDQNEEALYQQILTSFVIPSVDGTAARPVKLDPSLRQPLADALEEVRRGPLRVKPGVESRMIPSIAPKEQHRPFTPQ